MGLGAGQVAVDADFSPVTAMLSPVAVTATASVGTVATGFTVNDVRAIVAGPIVSIDLYLNRSGADIAASAGNVTDTTIFTLLSAFWPSHYVSCTWGDGTTGGEANVQSDGLVRIRTATDGGIISGRNIRISATYIVG